MVFIYILHSLLPPTLVLLQISFTLMQEVLSSLNHLCATYTTRGDACEFFTKYPVVGQLFNNP